MADYIFRGNLSETPLPEILQKIYYYKVPGVLEVSNKKGKRAIFISGGEVIFASSSFDEDRLGEFLLHAKRITQEQYDHSVELLRQSKMRQGAILVEIEALTPQELYRAVKDQVVAIVWSTFNWSEGDVSFAVGKFKDDEVIKLNLDTRTVIVQGIKQIEDAKRVARCMGKREDVYEPTDSALSLLPTLPLSLEDKRVFRLVDGIRTLWEMIQASSMESGITVKILYSLYILGLIRKKDQHIRITPSSTRSSSRI